MFKQTPLLLLMLVMSMCSSCGVKKDASSTNTSFVRVENGKLMKGDTPYNFVGANFWYGAILGSEGQGGNRARLIKELDELKDLGVDNLRILVGADGEHGVTAKVEPTLQVAPGVYNDTILAGLDYLLMEMGKRDMKAVLYLNNAWEWSGGYGQYLEWAGYGKAVIPAIDGWPAYLDFAAQFAQSDSAKALFANYVNDIITRENRYTKTKYTEDPTIMTWQISNEPRAFSQESKEPFAQWIADVAAQIKSLDSNHLVSTGSEGKHGCEADLQLFERIHTDPNVDYINIHIWPWNWAWAHKDSLDNHLPRSIENTKEYMLEHLEVAQRLKKPIVLEEFGFPRDGFQFPKTTSTESRDAYYQFVFDQIANPELGNGYLAGCNFWAWGGDAEQSPDHIYWQVGDDYTGDPAQEQQGLYSVFSTDTTVPIIKAANERLKNLL